MPILSDHCPLILTFGERNLNIKHGFNFFNAWTNENDFRSIVLQAWQLPVYGNPAFRLQQKLKNTKSSLRDWARNKFGTGSKQSTSLLQQLKLVQQEILQQSDDPTLSQLENELTAKLTEVLNAEASMIKQKSRQDWALNGDRNTKFYHAALKLKQNKAYIQTIKNENGQEASTFEGINSAFLYYYTNLLASQTQDQSTNTFLSHQSMPHLTTEHKRILSQPVTDDEIIRTVFSIRKEAAGGPDGFNAIFFTNCWDIIKSDFLKAVHNFFNKSTMLASINSTNIALIPKVDNPDNVTVQAYSMLQPHI